MASGLIQLEIAHWMLSFTSVALNQLIKQFVIPERHYCADCFLLAQLHFGTPLLAVTVGTIKICYANLFLDLFSPELKRYVEFHIGVRSAND